MLRKIVENNELPEYDLTFTVAGDNSPAVHFIRRSAAERAQIRAELEAETVKRARRAREDLRTAEVDGRVEPFLSRRVSPAGL